MRPRFEPSITVRAWDKVTRACLRTLSSLSATGRAWTRCPNAEMRVIALQYANRAGYDEAWQP